MSNPADKPFTDTLKENKGERTLEITINEEGFDLDQFYKQFEGILSILSLMVTAQNAENKDAESTKRRKTK